MCKLVVSSYSFCTSKESFVAYVFQQQANIDAYEMQLKQEQHKCTQAQTKLSQIKVGHMCRKT